MAGFCLQVALTAGLHLPAFASYLIQTALGVEANFLLNRWLTWRDRITPFWSACARFNAQRALTTTLNVAIYAALLHLGMNYLVANIALTAAFTVLNYVAGDRFVFRSVTGLAATPGPIPPPQPVIAQPAFPVRPDQVPATCQPEQSPTWRPVGVLPWPLLVIITVQVVMSLRLIWSNTAFGDEALYLRAGHMELAHLLHGAPIPSFATWFSGSPVIYPVIGAVADSHGGLATARLLSLAFMIGTSVCLYGTATRLFGRRAALFGCALFVTLGPGQALSAFATYDAMALFLLALATWLVVHARGPMAEGLLIAAGIVVALADATKYASTLWNPVIFAIAGLAEVRGGWLRSGLRGARLVFYTGTVLTVALFRFGGHAYMQGVMVTTLARAPATDPAGTVLSEAFGWIGPILFFSLLGLVLSLGSNLRTRLLCTILIVAVMLAPLNQARIHTTTSLHKHVVFGAFFAAMAAGYALARLQTISDEKGWQLGMCGAILVPLLGLGALQASNLFGYWENSRPMITALRPFTHQDGQHYLIEEDNVVAYYLDPQVHWDQLINVWDLVYPDPSTGQSLTGLTAYKKAIAAHYFSVVAVDFTEDIPGDTEIANIVSRTPGYRLAAAIPFSYYWGHKAIEIWVYTAAAHASGRPPYLPPKPKHTQAVMSRGWLGIGAPEAVMLLASIILTTSGAMAIRIGFRPRRELGSL